MDGQWPPSPSVEDEAAALAHEHLLDHSVAEIMKTDDQPAGKRGSVNQYPIILDSDQETDCQKEEAKVHSNHDSHSTGTQSSDESNGPVTPPLSAREQRFVHVPMPEIRTSETEDDIKKARSKSRHRAKEDDTPRGRPNVARIHTDLGSDLDDMRTGNRRAPSPYAYKAAQTADKPKPIRRYSGEHLLTPQQATAPRGFGINDVKRAASAKPQKKDDFDSSTDSDRQSDKKTHSRRLSTRKSFSRSDRPSLDLPATTFEKRSPQYAYSPAQSGLLSRELQESSKPAHSTTFQTHSRRTSKESPYNSSAEESRSRQHSGHASRADKRLSRESPLNSGDETKARHHRDQKDDGRLSRRSSMYAKQRPRLDSTGHRHSHAEWESPGDKHDNSKHRHDPKHHPVFDGRTHLEPLTPASNRTPQALEDAWEKAFRDNQAKVPTYPGRVSVNPSPCTSPPQTPPRTPRGDRRSKDFHELISPTLQPAFQPAQQWPRSPSMEQSQFKDLKPFAGKVGTAATATTSTNFIPPLSRSSTSSIEMTSSGSLSKPSSGHRSRKPSPVYEDVRPVSRQPSYVSREERPVLKPCTLPVNEERPVSRGGLYVQSPVDHPALPPRSLSYNSAVQPPLSRPGTSHRYSSNLLPSAAPVETAPRPAQARVVFSPSTAEKSPAVTPDHAVSTVPPPCPRSTPLAGYADWYTIKGIPEIDICPSCMATMGSSRFRDHFIPSMPKLRNQEVRCSMSVPWIRVAWVQIAKQNRATLEMLWKLTHLPSVTRPCPGKNFELRPWYRLIDPQTGRPVPNFEVCSACVHAVDNVFPFLRGALERSDSLLEERGCNLNTESKRFFGYIAEFDKAHTRCRGDKFRNSDIQGLADHARRVSRIRECARDGPLLTSAWHFMPDLPDFTICEECFQEVVWPLANKPIARNVNRTLKLVPTTRPGQFLNGRTCQLYSERMRRLFSEAVNENDLEILRKPALKRLEAEQLLQEKHALYMRDMKAGVDRKAEIERNSHIWKTWE